MVMKNKSGIADLNKKDFTTLACFDEDKADVVSQQFSAVFTSEPIGPINKPSAPDIFVPLIRAT